MNNQASHILQLGLFFAGAIIVLDVLLTQFPILDWFALGLVFCLIAATILGSVARTVPTQRHKSQPIQQKEDEFQYLTQAVNSALYGQDKKSLKILSEHIKSLALGAIAAQTRLTKKEILELAANDKQALQAVVQNDEIIKFLAGYQPQDRAPTEKEYEEMLSKIESWSR